MNVQNLTTKFLIVAGLIALAAYYLYPPEKTLKPGIDLAGGSSLLYEIDTEGLQREQLSNLAERIIEQLRKRVDPTNQRNLVWRPIGNTRIEIQMPAPTGEARERQEQKDEAISDLLAINVSRMDLLAALNEPADQRLAAVMRILDELPGQDKALKDKRQQLANDLVAAFEAYSEIRELEQAGDLLDAREKYDGALAAMLKTNLDGDRLTDVLALEQSSARAEQLDALKELHPSYAEAIDRALLAYDAWSKDRGGLEDPEDLKRMLRGQGVLEYRILAQRDPSNRSRLLAQQPAFSEQVSKYTQQLQERGPRPRGTQHYQWFKIQDPAKFVKADTPEEIDVKMRQQDLVIESYADNYYALAFADPDYGLLAGSERPWKLVNARPIRDPESGKPIVTFQLDRRGGEQFYQLTKNNIRKPLGVFLDGECMSHASIREPIRDRGQISGDFSSQDVQYLVSVLEAGSLPARLKEPPLSERTIGPSLGRTNIEKGLKAALWGLIAVAAFILVYYRLAGIVADLALGLNILFVLAAMSILEATFTLPGIAGLILTVGMAVDANVLIFERIREELNQGATLKMAVKIGYEKAFSTILDANLTTLITCVILGYAGSEEVKGFAIVLGLGVVFSMFTALFVTRICFAALIQNGLLHKLKMFRFFGVPNINWIHLRRVFWPISCVVVLCGAGLFMYEHDAQKSNVYDIEFLGGTAVTIELSPDYVGQMDDKAVRDLINGSGPNDDNPQTATGWLRYAAGAIADADVAVTPVAGVFVLSHPELTAQQLETVVLTTMADDIDTAIGEGAIAHSGSHAIQVTTKRDRNLNVDAVKDKLRECGNYLLATANRMNSAKVTTEWDLLEQRGDAPRSFEITTTETNKGIVREAIVKALGQRLNIQLPIQYDLRKNAERGGAEFFHISTPRLSDSIGGDTLADVDVGRFLGGVAIVFENIDPAQTVDELSQRLKTAKLLPEHEEHRYRPFEIVPLAYADEASVDSAGGRDVTVFALLTNDEDIVYEDDPKRWRDELAQPELAGAESALQRTQTLQKVTQFNPQIAGETTQQAIMAILLALVAIVIYIWFRFGNMQFGLAAIVALVHDVSISLGAVAATYYLSQTAIGHLLQITDMKIDLPMIAALLTIVGYSLNDSIVVFDRIRENRGKLKDITANITNQSINQTLSRTILTSLTTLMAVLIMYVFGGDGIHGFSFAMIIGVVVGTYSSVGIAAPLVLYPVLLRWIVNGMVVLVLFALAMSMSQMELQILFWGLLAIFAVVMAVNEIRRPRMPRGKLMAGA